MTSTTTVPGQTERAADWAFLTAAIVAAAVLVALVLICLAVAVIMAVLRGLRKK